MEMGVKRAVVISEEGAQFMMRSGLGAACKKIWIFLAFLFSTKANHYFIIQHPSFSANRCKEV